MAPPGYVEDIAQTVSGYVTGNLLLSVIAGTGTTIVLLIAILIGT